jgi:ABC-type transport system involved in Fe-S cluster assembly fused permease/ATPase subunit
MTLGDLVLVNALLLQLFIPLNFLGIVYRQIKYALADMDDLVRLFERTPEIRDAPDAAELQVTQGELRFENGDFRLSAGSANPVQCELHRAAGPQAGGGRRQRGR